MRAALAVALVSLVVVPAAGADAIPGATYNGTGEDGAGVSLTISPDGTLVTAFKITGAYGDTCGFQAEFDTGAWSGAPITNNAFDYEVGTGVLFKGTFPGAQSASGIFRLSHPPSGSSPACDTGLVGWRATTTASPPAGSGGGVAGGSGGGASSGGGGDNGSGGSGKRGGKRTIATRVMLRKVSSQLLGGRISSASACRASRTVILWRGSHRFAKTTSKANGTFSFRRSKMTQGKPVRASTLARTVRSGICAAGSSIFVRA